MKRTKYFNWILGLRQTTFVALFYYQVYESWSQLRTNLEYYKFKYLKLKELSPPVQSSILSQSLASLLSSVIEAQRRNKQTLQIQACFENSRENFQSDIKFKIFFLLQYYSYLSEKWLICKKHSMLTTASVLRP